MKKIKIFGLNSTKEFATKVANYLDLPLSKHIETTFEDGEHYIRSDENVRNCDVYVIQSLFDDKNNEALADKKEKLLFFASSLKDASAKRVTLVIPYLCYARMDRKTLSREGVVTKFLAMQIESTGTSRVLTIDHHNLAALQNSFRINTDNLEAKLPFINHLLKNIKDFKNFSILSGDAGGLGRCQRFRNALSTATKEPIDICYLDKSHIGKEIKGSHIIGNVEGKTVIALDDMFGTCKTMQQCADAVEKYGGNMEYSLATHGLFVGDKVNSHLEKIKKIVITDSVTSFGNLDEDTKKRVNIVYTYSLFGEAIKRTHSGGSISSLLTGNN